MRVPTDEPIGVKANEIRRQIMLHEIIADADLAGVTAADDADRLAFKVLEFVDAGMGRPHLPVGAILADE
jgi:hypothetical protein